MSAVTPRRFVQDLSRVGLRPSRIIQNNLVVVSNDPDPRCFDIYDTRFNDLTLSIDLKRTDGYVVLHVNLDALAQSDAPYIITPIVGMQQARNIFSAGTIISTKFLLDNFAPFLFFSKIEFGRPEMTHALWVANEYPEIESSNYLVAFYNNAIDHTLTNDAWLAEFRENIESQRVHSLLRRENA